MLYSTDNGDSIQEGAWFPDAELRRHIREAFVKHAGREPNKIENFFHSKGGNTAFLIANFVTSVAASVGANMATSGTLLSGIIAVVAATFVSYKLEHKIMMGGYPTPVRIYAPDDLMKSLPVTAVSGNRIAATFGAMLVASAVIGGGAGLVAAPSGQDNQAFASPTP